jgi:hypothetical protein
MNKQKALPALIVATVTALGLSSCATGSPSAEQTSVISADYPSYDSVKGLAGEADLIVEVSLGEAVDDVLLPQYEGDDPKLNPNTGTTEKPDPTAGAVPITVFDASVLNVYQGDATPGEVIKVMQPGGTKDNVEYVVDGMARLTAGSTVLLFLHTYPDSPADVLGGDVGAFTAKGDSFVSLNDDHLTVTSSELKSL